MPVRAFMTDRKYPFIEYSGLQIDSISAQSKDRKQYIGSFTLRVITKYTGIAELSEIGEKVINYFKESAFTLESSVITAALQEQQYFNTEEYLFTVKII